MKFGEKMKDLRLRHGLTQTELGRKLGLSKRTIISYETGDTYPRLRSVYTQLSEIFGVDINYLLTENEEFITKATEMYGPRGQMQAKDILEQTANLFAGGSLSADDELAFVTEIQRLYLDSKIRAKKYTPKKYLRRAESKEE
jgi:transcriptional regulator with XRE-family HTH domain